jgi:hypothetical protein
MWLRHLNARLVSIAGVFRARTPRSQDSCMSKFVHFIKDDSGATAVEYGLIAIAAGLAISAILPIIANS